jgi:hypothetical protein
VPWMLKVLNRAVAGARLQLPVDTILWMVEVGTAVVVDFECVAIGGSDLKRCGGVPPPAAAGGFRQPCLARPPVSGR